MMLFLTPLIEKILETPQKWAYPFDFGAMSPELDLNRIKSIIQLDSPHLR